jgi:hypothetical protein
MMNIMNPLELIGFIFLLLFISLLIFINIRLAFKNNEIAQGYAKALTENIILTDKVKELMLAERPEATEGFIKFLSQSREWAFEYIETVQSELNNFVEIVGPQMEYYDKYGRVIESVHTPLMNRIFDAYNELIKLLPEIENNKEK